MENTRIQLVQQHCLLLLKEIKRICDTYEIKYYLVGGSALGAYRHTGFIPWDDDIDIAIARSQYQFFLDVCKYELRESFYLQNVSEEQSFIFPFAKIRLNNSAYVDKDLAHLTIHHGLYVDIFPIDQIPNSKFGRFVQNYGLQFCNAVRMGKLGLKSPSTIKNKILIVFKLVVPIKCLPRFYKYFMCMAAGKDTTHSGNIVGAYAYEKEAMPMEYFGEGRIMLFEGLECRVPEKIEEFLVHVYGPTYMELPPINQRKTHNPIIISFTENYKPMEQK